MIFIFMSLFLIFLFSSTFKFREYNNKICWNLTNKRKIKLKRFIFLNDGNKKKLRVHHLQAYFDHDVTWFDVILSSSKNQFKFHTRQQK